MADVFDREKRSEVMSRIRRKGNKDTEIAIIDIFRKNHITGWRREQKVFGKPDFVFWKERVVVFVDGCFWHGCPVHMRYPKQNAEFWRKKLDSNIARDILVNEKLTQKNWNVVRIWEHELKNDDEVSDKIIIALGRKAT